MLAGVAAGVFIVLAGCGGGGGAKGPATLNWYVFKDKSGSFDYAAKQCSKQSGGKYTIKIQLLPADADGQREQLVRRLAAKDSSIDLIGMDVIWTAEFAEAKWIKPWSGADRARVERGTLAKPLQTASYKGTLWGAPLNSNAQVLYYRKDLVPNPPKTWAEMLAQGQKLGAKGKIEVQAAQYEGLTVWFNSLLGSAGGQILASPEKAALGPPAVAALDVMKKLAISPAADPSMSNAKEDQANIAFEGGKAAFQVNYPAFYSTIKKEAPKVFAVTGIAPWPSVTPGQPSHTTIGGINLGVGAFTKHPTEAFAAAQCLRNRPNQKYAQVNGSFAPSIADLFQDPDVKKAQPFSLLLKVALEQASLRPVTPAYTDISLAVQKTLSPPSGIDPPSTAKDLKSKIDKALKSGGLL